MNPLAEPLLSSDVPAEPLVPLVTAGSRVPTDELGSWAHVPTATGTLVAEAHNEHIQTATGTLVADARNERPLNPHGRRRRFTPLGAIGTRQTISATRGCLSSCLSSCLLELSVCWSVVAAICILLLLFEGAKVAMYEGTIASYEAPTRNHGPLAGLQAVPDGCSIAAVYHRNIVTHNMVHFHHPHHPHHPHSPHDHSPSLKRHLAEEQSILRSNPFPRHKHSPRPHAPPPLPPPPLSSPSPSPPLPATPPSSPPPSSPPPQPPWARGENGGNAKAVCYDRWVFAFVPPPASESLPPAGEPLSVTRARLLSRGWREVQRDSSLDETSADVVLSPPLHRQRVSTQRAPTPD